MKQCRLRRQKENRRVRRMMRLLEIMRQIKLQRVSL